MNPIILLGFIAAAMAAVAVPWFGVVLAYAIAILNPQAIWWWQFEGFRPAFFVTLPLLFGFALLAARGTLRWDAVRNVRTAALLVLLACCAVSSVYGPYALHGAEHNVRSAEYILEVQAKIILMYLIACLCASDERALKWLAWMVVGCSAYLVYWANSTYFSLGWVRRLAGPVDIYGVGIYYDENNFATFFVSTLPFLWYMGKAMKSVALRYAMWAVVPLGWHAIFLTGSRGGMLGMGAALLVMTMRPGMRIYGTLLIAAFVVAFQYQGGDEMKERMATLNEYEQDGSATGRLDAWGVATDMMTTHPVTGVGPGAFLRAFPSFSERSPLQAHSTYFQIGAEYGPLAAVALLVAIASSIVALARTRRAIVRSPMKREFEQLLAINEATLVGLVGLFVCSLFLTLQLFELLYFYIFLSSAVFACARRRLAEATNDPDKSVVQSEDSRNAQAAQGYRSIVQ